jgi:hypothetical protein
MPKKISEQEKGYEPIFHFYFYPLPRKPKMKNTQKIHRLSPVTSNKMSYYSILTSCNRVVPIGLFTTKTLDGQILKLKSWMKKIDKDVKFESVDLEGWMCPMILRTLMRS